MVVSSRNLVAFLTTILMLEASSVSAAAPRDCELSFFNAFTSPLHDSLTILLDGEPWATIPFGERVIEPVPCTGFTLGIAESNGTVEQHLDIFRDNIAPLAWAVYRGVHDVFVGQGFSAIRVNTAPPDHGGILIQLHGGDSPFSGNTVLQVSTSDQTFELEDASEEYYHLDELEEDNTELTFTLFFRDQDGSESGDNESRTKIWEKSIVATGAGTLTVVYVYGYSDEGPLGPGVEEPMMKVYEDEVWGNADSAARTVAPVMPWF
ncbi:hypothetical protein QOT17_002694 [Balamuthia mandrillaris]